MRHYALFIKFPNMRSGKGSFNLIKPHPGGSGITRYKIYKIERRMTFEIVSPEIRFLVIDSINGARIIGQ